MLKGLSHVPDYYEKWPAGVVPYILDKTFSKEKYIFNLISFKKFIFKKYQRQY